VPSGSRSAKTIKPGPVFFFLPSSLADEEYQNSPPSTYNQQGHVRARSNRMDPYPTESMIWDHTRKVQHHLERYRDVFFMDHIWGAAKVWRERLPAIKMLVF